MNLARFPLGKPHLALLPAGSKYPFEVMADFVYCWPGHGDWPALDIVVPRGYLTDLLSVPRPLWPVLPPHGAGAWGALPHDLLYGTQFSLPSQSAGDARAMDDRILLDAARDSGASTSRARTLYAGVRIGGGPAWNNVSAQEASDDLQAMVEATERWENHRK